MSDNSTILSGEDLVKRFAQKGSFAARSGVLTAVDGVNLPIREGETVGIAGESGCGKSTLAKILAGLIKPNQGSVLFRGTDISRAPNAVYRDFRRQTQMIFQDPFSSLNPRMRIGDIIGEPLALSGSSGRELRETVEALMNTVGLNPAFFSRFPHEFSGGQRQRIGIARALAPSPSIIVADEPVSALDVSIQAQIINLLVEMKKTYRLSLVIISHDLSVLRHICDRVAIMYLGSIVETAPASRLFQRCLHPYSEALLAAVPRLLGGKSAPAALLRDDVPSPLAIPPGCRFHTRCPYARDICRTEPPPLSEKAPDHWAACHFSKELFL